MPNPSVTLRRLRGFGPVREVARALGGSAPELALRQEDSADLIDQVYRRTLSRARAFTAVVLALNAALFYFYDYANYAAGRWDESPFYPYGVVWRAATVVGFALLLAVDLALWHRRPSVGLAHRVIASLYPVLIIAMGTAQSILNQYIVADVSVYALCVLTVATLLHLPNRATWALYPLSLGVLVVGIRAFHPEPEVWTGIATNAAAIVVVAFVLERMSYRSRLRNLTSARTIGRQNARLQEALADVQAAQTQLVHQEKMASLGHLTAGIAHELKNPLNFVNNFSELNVELVGEAEAALDEHDGGSPARAALLPILADLRKNAVKVREHGRRADGIIQSMMRHARGTAGSREPVDLNALAEEFVALAYHGHRAQSPSRSVTVACDVDPDVGVVPLVRQEMGQVLVNLLSNALDAVAERAASAPEGYVPEVVVRTRRRGDEVDVSVEDNGAGIADAVRGRVFEPFFTSKPAGQGTGLGLSIAYDIVQSHGGRIEVDSRVGEGSTFTVTLPTSA